MRNNSISSQILTREEMYKQIIEHKSEIDEQIYIIKELKDVAKSKVIV